MNLTEPFNYHCTYALYLIEIIKKVNHYKTKKGLKNLILRPLYKNFRQRPTLPQGCPCSTIGAIKLNFRVRDGNGCLFDAIATEKIDIYTISSI